MTPDRLGTLKTRLAATRDALGGLNGFATETDSPSFIGMVYANPLVPTTTGAFFSAHPVTITGPERESQAGTLSVNPSATVLVHVVGPEAPVAGDLLICRFVRDRWVAERMTAKDPNHITLFGCPCRKVPTTLTMTSTNPNCNNRMFQSTTLVYGPPPAELAPLLLGANAYLSPGSFSDYDTGESFRYWFTCFNGIYTIGRVYANSIHGSPRRDLFRYSWLIGASGNSCAPFLLSNGLIFQGGDPTCHVVISA